MMETDVTTTPFAGAFVWKVEIADQADLLEGRITVSGQEKIRQLAQQKARECCQGIQESIQKGVEQVQNRSGLVARKAYQTA